ncbi:glycine decarboxylase subunit P SCDLUD_001166 [Saccharomycodes ludwigii]|uniref:glycine decarboxylase subunit P n=1 Tax=Saccharomycodes ludwigii TaxID=36035 RepID=UPI001E827B78|nr:hypothetical protein SCDLUD_001166 [Saccharomycodes ludwigii]KAH3903525.1 hypothetical protein SCDLUD_001166 [Saccharomycodes ludwigii]
MLRTQLKGNLGFSKNLTKLSSILKFEPSISAYTFGACFQSSKANVSSENFASIHSPSEISLKQLDTFQRRHLGPNVTNVSAMLKTIGYENLDEFINNAVPPQVLSKRKLDFVNTPANGFTESEILSELKTIASKNKPNLKNFIGKGYYGTILPPVIQRNLLESPEWYTSYTPYQPEISQGRLESLLNFQTVISDLTGLPVANASLLDEGTAGGEALLLSYYLHKKKKNTFIIDSNLFTQTKSVLKTRAEPFGIKLIEVDFLKEDVPVELLENNSDVFGCMVQYPGANGEILAQEKLTRISELVHKNKGLFSVASDLMALTLLTPPSSFGADICFGSSQRFGCAPGYGGPHAAFFSVVNKLNRKIPGRIVGVSKDRLGRRALRLALQTREQHIKRDKATSNICTAEALLANIAAMYCVYHGPDGLKKIASRIYGMTTLLAHQINNFSSHNVTNKNWFDTLTIQLQDGISADEFMALAVNKFSINLFRVNDSTVALSLDETTTKEDLIKLNQLFTGLETLEIADEALPSIESLPSLRTDAILSNKVFHLHHTETAMLRYLHRLQSRDLSLANSMIPLGSCTMKLNSTVEMIPITWPEFANVHPFQPANQVEGYRELISAVENDLSNITGFDATSLQPTSGASGEYTGLRVIQSYLKTTVDGTKRNICLIPVSAHGTNPASAAMSGMKVVPVKCLKNGSLDLEDLTEKATKYRENLACIMITYPSTYGLFEPFIKDAINIVHENGGQVYMDGANMNAQVGLTSPGDLGADVCHLNLHKTFAVPHGGGGPPNSAICVKPHLAKFLPQHDVAKMITNVGEKGSSIPAVSSAAYGNASLLPIPFSYIKMMGSNGLPYSSVIALLNANYMMNRLRDHYKILFIGGENESKHCAHEFIVDLREFKSSAGIEAIDVAKRLQDYGFHAPTLAFPVPGTLMIEPTECENKEELDRFVDAMISIRKELDYCINKDPRGQMLKNAPHSLEDVVFSKDWETTRRYTREEAVYPLPYLLQNKFWPQVARLDDTYGDLHLMCTCPSVEEVAKEK